MISRLHQLIHWLLYPAPRQAERNGVPICPRCRQPMRRTLVFANLFGPGNCEVWGCRNHPAPVVIERGCGDEMDV